MFPLKAEFFQTKKFYVSLLFIFIIALYFHVSYFGVTGSDDKTLISNISSQIQQGKSFIEIVNAPYMFNNGLFYRPVITASFTLIYYLSENLFLQFVLNIIIHSITAMLFFYILIQLNTSKQFSLLLVLIFAVAPFAVNSVAWLPGRNDSLAAMFILGAFLFLLLNIQKNKLIYFIISALLLLISFFAKETALLAVPVFIIFIFLFNYNKKFSLYKILVWLLLVVIWYIARKNAIQNIPEAEFTANLLYLFIAPGLILVPFNLSVLPVIKDMQIFPAAAGTLITILLYFYSDKTSRKLYFFGVLFYIIFLIPALVNKNPEFTGNIMLESRLYLPAVGIFIMLASIESSIKKILNVSILYISAFAFAVIFLIISYIYTNSYSNEINFWNNARKNSPSLDLSFAGMGLVLLQNGRYEESLIEYKKAIELNPARGEYYSKSAYCCLMLNRTDEADVFYTKYLKYFPDDFDANLILGIINYKKTDYIEAEKYLKTAAVLNPQNMQPITYLAKLYAAIGEKLKAMQQLELLKKNNTKIPAELEYLLQ